MRRMYGALVGMAALVALAGCQTTDHDTTMAEESMADDTMMAEESMADDTMMDDSMGMGTEFVVTIEVLAGSPTPIAPVAWALHTGSNPFTYEGMGKPVGLEALAEDGDPSAIDAALRGHKGIIAHGVANTPSGSTSPGPATPRTSYTFTVTASEGQTLSFATMYVQSNDLFYSPGVGGLALFDMAEPIHGDVTSEIALYDAGTEVNERPGSGRNQPIRQAGPNTGPSESRPISPIGETMDGFTYPATGTVIRVTVEPHTGMM